MQINGSGGNIRRTGFAKRHKQMSDINVTPFVDVMLVLLVVFMVTILATMVVRQWFIPIRIGLCR